MVVVVGVVVVHAVVVVVVLVVVVVGRRRVGGGGRVECRRRRRSTTACVVVGVGVVDDGTVVATVVVVVGVEVVVVVPAAVTVSVPAESFQCWNGFQPGPNIPTLIVRAPRAWSAGTLHWAVNVRVTPLVNDWLSQNCWNTLPFGPWISTSTRPRRVVDDFTVTDTDAVVPRGTVPGSTWRSWSIRRI